MEQENELPNARCETEGHSRHLCILTDQFFHLRHADEYKAMVAKPRFKCLFCGRTAKSDQNVCYPTEL